MVSEKSTDMPGHTNLQSKGHFPMREAQSRMSHTRLVPVEQAPIHVGQAQLYVEQAQIHVEQAQIYVGQAQIHVGQVQQLQTDWGQQQGADGVLVEEIHKEAGNSLHPQQKRTGGVRVEEIRKEPGKFSPRRQQRNADGVLVEARHLHKRLYNGVDLLQDISFCVRPSELVVLVGLSDAGKTTLMEVLAGYHLPSEGEIFYDGVSLTDHLDTFRTRIGFVPQREIMHLDLTVFEALAYAAKLRLPPTTTAAMREARVREVLSDLDLTEQRNVQVRKLSSGQRKRVSIGIELLTRPHLFLLDEPTSGLDPHRAVELMDVLRKLAAQGRTILLISHATKDMMLADQVLFMLGGGYVAWYGPPAEALTYFDTFRSAQERASGSIGFDGVYGLLEDPNRGTPQEWARRYTTQPVYQRLIARPLHLSLSDLERQGQVPSVREQERAARVSRQLQAGAFLQMIILTARALKLVIRDRMALLLMLVALPLLTSMLLILTSQNMFDPLLGNPNTIALSFTLLIFMAMVIGAMSFMYEIVKEKEIFKREHHVNLKIMPYILSKAWVVFLFALYQAACWLGGLYLAVNMPGGWATALSLYISLFLATFVGMLLGLVGSALSVNQGVAPLLTAMLVMPQIIFSGALLPIPQLNEVGAGVTKIMPARFAFEAMLTAGGYGKDVADDPDWKLPEKERLALIDQQKRRDRCLGENIFTQCDFPGIRKFYNSAVNQPEPVAPDPPSGAKASSVQAYQQYLRDLRGYQEKLATWKELRSRAINGAEARIAIDHERFGPIYNVNLIGHWGALLFAAAVLVVALVVIQRVKQA